jgi:ACR3 family arsenite efflux pump ArsB
MLTLVWGWVVGPAFAVLLTKVLPLAEPYAIGLLIFSLAPVAPMVSLLARKARSDMDFTAAVVPLAMVATVVLLPLLAPWLMKGLTLNAWSWRNRFSCWCCCRWSSAPPSRCTPRL